MVKGVKISANWDLGLFVLCYFNGFLIQFFVWGVLDAMEFDFLVLDMFV